MILTPDGLSGDAWYFNGNQWLVVVAVVVLVVTVMHMVILILALRVMPVGGTGL